MRGFELENGYIDISPLKDGSIVLFRREGTSKRNWYGRIRLNHGKYQKFTTKTSDLKSAEKIVKRRYTEMYMLGDQFSARLVCNIKDSWTRSDPTFLKSVASRCDRFAQSGDQSFIREYPMSDIENLEKVLESPVLKVESD